MPTLQTKPARSSPSGFFFQVQTAGCGAPARTRTRPDGAKADRTSPASDPSLLLLLRWRRGQRRTVGGSRGRHCNDARPWQKPFPSTVFRGRHRLDRGHGFRGGSRPKGGPAFAGLARNSELPTLQKSVRGRVACEVLALNRQREIYAICPKRPVNNQDFAARIASTLFEKKQRDLIALEMPGKRGIEQKQTLRTWNALDASTRGKRLPFATVRRIHR